MIKKISVSILSLIIAVIIYGCEGVDLGGGSPSDGVIFKITDNTGQVEFMSAPEERVLLSIIEEKGYSIPGLEVTIFTDGKNALNSLIMIIDPKHSYVPYIFSPSEDDIIAKSVGDNKAQYTVTRYITRQMIDIEEAVDKEEGSNPIYQERLANLDRYLVNGGYYEKKFTCPGNELNSYLKEYWDNSDLSDKTCLSSLEEKFLAHLALKENEEAMLNIFKIDEIRQEQDYLKGGYVLNQLFEVYYPKMSTNKALPFPIIRPQGEPTNIPPMVDIEADKVQGSPPLEVRFVANVYDEDGYIVSYSWDFGDATTSNEQAPTHIYERRGVYTAVCKVSDNSGAYAEDWVKVEVNNPPLIFVTANPTSGNPPLAVQFRADAYDSDGSIRGYNWDFGDGTTSNEQNPSHVYTVEGRYVATCVVTDNMGSTAIDAVMISAGKGTIPGEDTGSYMVYKASQPITSGTVEFDVTGLSSAGSTKDVMFVLTKGMTRTDYENYRFDIRKYEGGLHLMKSVFVNRANGNFAVEKYWMDRERIYWEPTHTYHFTITWGDYQAYASRKDTNTGEEIEVSINYRGAGEFGPTYIMIGWNPKYGIPPGGRYFNIKLPAGASYELVKYKD